MKKTVTVAKLMGEHGGILFGDTNVLPGKYGVKVMQVHHRLHFEEMVAIVILNMYGEEMFPGIEKAAIQLVDAGVNYPDAFSLLEEGVLQIGVGNGPFNEHETHTRLAIDGECGATLVAKLLRVSEDPCLVPILKYALRSDTTQMAPMELSSIIKIMYDYRPEEEVVTMGTQVAQVLIQKQLDFHGAARMTLESAMKMGNGGIIKTPVFGGTMATLVWIKTEEDNVTAFARSKAGHDAAIVIQESSPGKFYIPANKRADLDLDESVRFLRLAELHAKGMERLPEGLYERLTDEVCAECLEWHYDREKTNSIFGGGSRSNKDVPASRLNMEEVLVAVRRGLIRRPPFAGHARTESSARREDAHHGHHARPPFRREANRTERRPQARRNSQPAQEELAAPPTGISAVSLKELERQLGNNF